MMVKFGIFSIFVFILCWASWLGVQAREIYLHGFLECFETTNFYGNEMLCVRKEM